MKTLFFRLLTISFCLLIFNEIPAQIETISGAQVTEARFLGRTGRISEKANMNIPDIREKKQLFKNHYRTPENFKGSVPMKNTNTQALPLGDDPIRQIYGFNSMLVPVDALLNFDGNDQNDSGVWPPDTNGDVSPDHYVQVTNGGGSIIRVFDKDGNLLMGPTSLNALWVDLGFQGLGDPIILWDQQAERWLFTEFASGGATLLAAVSETSDPMGSFFAYEFQTPNFPDYPKYGIGPDAYYITTNEPSDDNIPIYVIDRTAMLNGEATASIQRLGIPKFPSPNVNTFQVATPMDWDGAFSPPPAGSPHYIIRLYDDSWNGGQDKLEVWEVDIDFDDPNNTTLTGPIELFTEPFDASLCNGNIFDCLDQPNSGVNVSALMQVIMHRVNYRSFGGYEAIVLNHSVDIDGNNLAGIRWYELRKPSGGQWEIYQQGTFSPDNNNRWMGSIAMDASGNIALGYTIMGPDNSFDLAFTGRKNGDPLGQMTVDENVFIEGTGTNPVERWGDYSMMSVDEADGRTFWYTGEYMKGGGDWGTRVVSFQLPRDTMDVAPLNLVSPITSAFNTATEPVEVTIKNFGLDTVSNFDVGLILDDVFIESTTVTQELAPDSTLNVVFNGTVDLSAIGEYRFRLYTNLVDDDNVLNDTIRPIVRTTPRLDAAIDGVTNLDEVPCDTFLLAGIVLKNEGADTLTSATVEWTLNGGTAQIINWTGSLAIGESEILDVTLSPLVTGANTLVAMVSMPNGMPDENTENDELTRNLEAVVDGGIAQFFLLTDNYPGETTWQLENESGTILYTGGPYGGAQTIFEEDWCLAEGCYTFTIFDTYGDGIQFGGVFGDYQITDENGIILASLQMANFGFSETVEFCFPFECTLEGSATTMNESATGANDGIINISTINAAEPIQYSIDGGTTFGASNFFSNLPGGTYDIVVVDANGCEVSFQITVETCSLSFSAEVTDATQGQADGIIEITTEMGLPPFIYSIDGGQTFQDSSTFVNVPEGMYDVLVEDALGCEFTLTVNVMGIVGINETTFGNSIEIFPNPTEGVFRINVRGIDTPVLNVSMIDSNGKLIMRNRLVRYDDLLTGHLSLRNFPSGIYFVMFEHKDITRMAKIVRK